MSGLTVPVVARYCGSFFLCALALTASGSAVWSTPLSARGQSTSLQGPAALAELERRGEKGAALAALNGAMALTGPTYVKAFNAGSDDWFGMSVALSGNTLVVGAPLERGSQSGVNPPTDDLGFNKGAAYVFVRYDGAWVQQAYLKASNAEDDDRFGSVVAISGETIVVSAPWEDGSGTGINPPDNNGAIQAGAVYVFQRRDNIWTQEAYLKGSNTAFADFFGSSLALAGNTLVVGARCEDGSGTGVNPAADDSILDAGAAYVFRRNAGTWSQEAYLKASNPDVNDFFGDRVAVSGDTVVVSTAYEDGSGTGVNPPSNEGTFDSGAAYVFERKGGVWALSAYLKGASPAAGDAFGYAAAVSGDVILIGAIGDSDGQLWGGRVSVFARAGTTWTTAGIPTPVIISVPRSRSLGALSRWGRRLRTAVEPVSTQCRPMMAFNPARRTCLPGRRLPESCTSIVTIPAMS
jgi:hypothetical protein